MQFLAQKSSKKESKMDQNSNTGPTPKKANRYFSSADWHKLEAWPEDSGLS